MPLRARICIAATLVSACLAPRAARADDTRAAAQAMFDDAMKRMVLHAYDRACPELEDVLKMMPGKVGALMELSRCYEEWGKTASAWSRYRATAEAAAALSDPREEKARAKAAELERRVPKLTIAVAPANRDTKGFTVQRDGHDLGAAEWDAALPADPGKHAVVASAPGKKRWTGEVIVAPNEAAIAIEIPALEDDPSALPAPAPGPATPAPDTHAPPAAGAPVWPWVAGGLGLASLGLAIGFGVDGLLAKGSLSTLCHGTLSPCAGHTAAEIDPLNARKDRGLALFIGLGLAGAGGLVTGVVALVRRPKTGEALVVTPVAGPGLAGAEVRVRF
jgi:hypothetical protein